MCVGATHENVNPRSSGFVKDDYFSWTKPGCRGKSCLGAHFERMAEC